MRGGRGHVQKRDAHCNQSRANALNPERDALNPKRDAQLQSISCQCLDAPDRDRCATDSFGNLTQQD